MSEDQILLLVAAVLGVAAVWLASDWGAALYALAAPEKRGLAKRIGTGAVIFFGLLGVALVILVVLF
jgi:hypothetical protein